MPRAALTLADVRQARLAILCDKCGRRGDYAVARLRQRFGEANLPTLLTLLAADCPRALKRDWNDWCGVQYEGMIS